MKKLFRSIVSGFACFASPVWAQSEQLAALVKSDSAKWGRIIRDKKIKGE